MKKRLFIVIFVALALPFTFVNKAAAQDYNSAIGVGLGADMSINYKYFVSRSGALEAQFGYNVPCNGVMFSVVYQHHFTIAKNFYIYLGGGINIGGLHLNNHNNDTFVIGIDPTVGFEYSFSGTPIALAADYKPNINFIGHSQWNIAALKIRFKI